MCLFRHDEQENTCNHEECANYYLLNKQICMYNNNHTNQLNQPNTNNNNVSNIKRANNMTLPKLDDSDVLNLIKKKVKIEASSLDNENLNLPANDKTIQESNTLQSTIGFQTYNNLNSEAKKELLSNTLFTNLINQNNTTIQKPENPASNSKFVPYIQNLNQAVQQQQPTNQNLTSQLSLVQYLTQNLKLPQTNILNPVPSIHNGINSTTAQSNFDGNSSFSLVNKTKQQQQQHQGGGGGVLPSTQLNLDNISFEGLSKDFQQRILGLLITQNKMLVDLKEKNDFLQDTLACLINEVNVLRGIVNNKSPTIDKSSISTTTTTNSLYLHQMIGNPTDASTTENLLNYLYGNNQDFTYQLILKSELSLPLYRERNFKFTVLLTDKNGNPIENSNRISLTIGIYSSENPPKYIDTNTSGNKILKGLIEKDLINGQATFEKIQIKEVTSHFRNGWIFFIVYPKLSLAPTGAGLGSTNTNVTSNGNIAVINGGPQQQQHQNHHMMMAINPSKIKPLILEKVIVKAKKSKEKDLNESTEIYGGDESKLNEMNIKQDQMLANKQDIA